jgi:hypothetical protein
MMKLEYSGDSLDRVALKIETDYVRIPKAMRDAVGEISTEILDLIKWHIDTGDLGVMGKEFNKDYFRRKKRMNWPLWAWKATGELRDSLDWWWEGYGSDSTKKAVIGVPDGSGRTKTQGSKSKPKGIIKADQEEHGLIEMAKIVERNENKRPLFRYCFDQYNESGRMSEIIDKHLRKLGYN